MRHRAVVAGDKQIGMGSFDGGAQGCQRKQGIVGVVILDITTHGHGRAVRREHVYRAGRGRETASQARDRGPMHRRY